MKKLGQLIRRTKRFFRPGNGTQRPSSGAGDEPGSGGGLTIRSTPSDIASSARGPHDGHDPLLRYLLEADERLVYRARPTQIAHHLRTPVRSVLERLVEAMFAGDAVLHWEVECPRCGPQDEGAEWLQRASHDYTCPMCGQSFDVHLDHHIQITFSPHPRLRTLKLSSTALMAGEIDFRSSLYAQFPATTAHELLAVQSFRDWAQNITFPPSEYLEVRHTVIWFSDLTGSTALYARNGDPSAYRLVREHYELVFDAIHRAQGAVVKTIGDGIMAVFTRGDQAIAAALEAHQALARFNRERELPPDRQLHVKIVVHAGPAIAVNLNDRLDYFGTTVNVAARLSEMAGSDEILFTESVHVESEVHSLLVAETLASAHVDIPGIDQNLLSYRLHVQGRATAR